jgi:hypothetical protein
MSTQRKRYSAEFKARVALEAIKGHKTVNELASTYGVLSVVRITSLEAFTPHCPTQESSSGGIVALRGSQIGRLWSNRGDCMRVV